MDTKLVIDFLTELGKQASIIGQQAAGVAQNVFQVYVRHQYVVGVTDLIVSILILMVCTVITILAVKADDEEMIGVVAFIDIIGLVVLIFLVPGAVLHMGSPEYYAIRELLNAIH